MSRAWILVVALLSSAPCAAQTAPERLEKLAAESFERGLDLFPVGEIFSREIGRAHV